jgi:hypothetical protein
MISKIEFFYILAKYLPEKTMIFFNIMILSQKFKNILFPNTPVSEILRFP